MSKKYFLATKIKATKNNILKKYHFSAASKQLGTSGNFDTTKCVRDNKEHCILKIRKNKKYKKDFLKEIYVNQLLSKHRAKKHSITFPKYIGSNTKTSPEWLVYQYVEGLNAGGWYNFDAKKLNVISKKLPSMIILLSKISLQTDQFQKIRHKEILQGFKRYQKILKKYFTDAEIQKGQEIINKNKKLLNSTKLILTHGDLHPGNIILTPQKQLTIIDWSDSHLNNRAYDAAFIWFELWNQPKHQKQFLNTLLQKISAGDGSASGGKNKKEFQELFIINLIRLTPKMLEVVSSGHKYFNQLKKKSKTWSKHQQRSHQTVKNAIKYFISNYKKIIKLQQDFPY
jgi:thiamine kinase-like enzyme